MKTFLTQKRKGSILLVTIFFILMSFAFLGFAYDISRIMYFKSYTRHLASSIALSIVNECGYVYYDNENKGRVVIVQNPGMRPNDYKGKYYANKDYVKILLEKNKENMDKSLHINLDKIRINPQRVNNKLILGATDLKRFEEGTDGINGEIEIHITAEIDLFFLKNPFKARKTIQESAVAQPKAFTSSSSNEQKRDEQEIRFDYVDWVH